MMAIVGLKKLQSGQAVSRREQVVLVAQLSWPAILAQISSVVMQYIDTAMVGQLGSHASASIGVVTSTTWLFGEVCGGMTIGFNVAVAQALGAREEKRARSMMRLAFLVCMAFSLLLMAAALVISGDLPRWLRADLAIREDACTYFRVFALALPFLQLNNLCGGMLRSAGYVKTSGICMAIMCLLDVVFNAFLIFPAGAVHIFGTALPGFDLGVKGAAVGTALSQILISLILTFFLLVRSPELHWRRGEKRSASRGELLRCLRISAPVMTERGIKAAAQMVMTTVVAPLGIVATAANSLAVTAEGLCYMPAYGVQSAASALIGQSVGSGRRDLTYRLGRLTVVMGMGMMAVTGIALYWLAPTMMRMMSVDAAVIALGVRVLRIEAFAEPLFGATIVANGVFQGAGSTLIPMLVNFATMWGIRLPLAMLLAPKIGLTGVWIAMAAELGLCGLCFLLRLLRKRWLP